MKIWRKRITCRVTKAANTNSWNMLIPIAFPLQQWLHEHACVTLYVHCLVKFLELLHNNAYL
jgi:hypothetical protein